ADDQTRWIERAQAHLVGNYRQLPMVLERGEGCRVWDVSGVRYLDMTAGIAVSCLGHAHPKLGAALGTQAQRLIHVSNLHYNRNQIVLAEALAQRTPLEDCRVFFCNSGAEANEAALKLARRYQAVVCGQAARVEILGFHGSFHGRTFATVAVTGQEKYRTGFGPLVEPVRLVPYGDERAPRTITQETCAVIVEPVQGEGGVVVPPIGFLQALRA